MRIYTIDPGVSGAVCVLYPTGDIRLHDAPVVKEKGKSKYVAEQMADVFGVSRHIGDVVVIENVHAMPGQGVTSMFNMGYGCGLWRGIAAGLRIPVEMVAPQVWKKALGLGSDKGEAIRKACSLYPHMSDQLSRKKDDGRAEALLIAHWYRIHKRGPELAASVVDKFNSATAEEVRASISGSVWPYPNK